MTEFLFVLVVMFGVFVQSLVGFGGTLLSMPLGIMLLGLNTTKPIITFGGWITGVIVLIAEYKHINWKEFAKMTGVMLLGVLGGIWATGKVQLNFLLIIYGLIVAGIGAKKLFLPSVREASPTIQNICLAIAGLMQGFFVSGGSFLVVYAVARIKEKQEFRATVNAVWAFLNIIMVATFALNGSLTREVMTMGAICIVPILVAIWLGGLLTKKVNQATFLKAIYIVLIVSGLVLLVTNL